LTSLWIDLILDYNVYSAGAEMGTRYQLATVLGLVLFGMLQNQTYGQSTDRFRVSLVNSCVKAAGAPPENVVGKKYCECSADAIIAQFSFDERMRIAVQIDEENLPASTKEKLREITKACLKQAVQ